MAIDVQCVCGKRLRVADEMAGRQGRCPECQELVQIPHTSDDLNAGLVAETGAPSHGAPQAAPPPRRPPPPRPQPTPRPAVPSRPATTATETSISNFGYAGFWMRFVAYLVDASILAVAVGIVDYVVALAIGKSLVELLISLINAGMTGEGGALLYLAALLAGIMLRTVVMWIVILVFGWMYFALFEASSWMATPGKILFGLVVVDARGDRISFWNASLRHAGKFCAFAPMIVSILLLSFDAATGREVTSTLLLLALSILLTPVLSIIVYGMAGWTARKQALYDRFADCYVIRAKELNPGVFMASVFGAIIIYLVVHFLLRSSSG